LEGGRGFCVEKLLQRVLDAFQPELCSLVWFNAILSSLTTKKLLEPQK